VNVCVAIPIFWFWNFFWFLKICYCFWHSLVKTACSKPTNKVDLLYPARKVLNVPKLYTVPWVQHTAGKIIPQDCQSQIIMLAIFYSSHSSHPLWINGLQIFVLVLGLELITYTLSHSTSPFLWRVFFEIGSRELFCPG
jgi:hypothetical protein